MRQSGMFGTFGGVYVPETLMPALEELEQAFIKYSSYTGFMGEVENLLRDYAGRPTPLYYARNLSRKHGSDIFLKREDLLHGGAHKTNNALGQALLARMMGKRRIIAETGAGQHGVACAMAGALMGIRTEIYMGEVDMQRQQPNVYRMRLLGAQLHPVTTGSRTLKDAINEALRDWITNLQDTHYLLGTAAGPHPFPSMVKFFQSVIGKEVKEQFFNRYQCAPDYVVACVGGGSNAIGIFSAFLQDTAVKLVGVEPAGRGLHTAKHGAVLRKGVPGCLHGMKSMVLQDEDGQVQEAHSIAAGLDYPSVGPEHAYLQATGRVQYESATDDEALAAFKELAQTEGIIPALESSHALAFAVKLASQAGQGKRILVNLSGRGDKDIEEVLRHEQQICSQV